VRSDKRNGRTPAKARRMAWNVRLLRRENENRLSVILEIGQGAERVKRVLRHVEKLRPKELLLVAHGSDERTLETVFSHASQSMTIFVYPFPLGMDVWRAIGAREATGDVLLLLGTQEVVPAAKLFSLVQACYRGADIAAGRAERTLRQAGIGRSDALRLAEVCLNGMLAKFRGSALTDLPLAIRRESLGRIGAEHLMVPPLAYAMAVKSGLKVEQIGKESPSRKLRPGAKKTGRARAARAWREAEVRLGDYLEALHYVATHADGNC